MSSTYAQNSGIELIGTGDQSGSWGDTTNINLQIIDRLADGVGSISLSGTTYTLTTSNGALSEGQYRVIVFGGSPSGTNTVTISPNTSQHMYAVKNNSGQSVILTQGSGSTVTVANGTSKLVYCDGVGSTSAVTDITATFAMSNVSITGGTITGITDLAIADGGTGASTAGQALTNLGAAAIASPTFTGNVAVTSNTTSPALTITQTGAGAALLVEDSASPDSTPFIVTTTGNVGIGVSNPAFAVQAAIATTADFKIIGVTETDYLAGFKATYIQQYGASATGTSYGISNANLGLLIFQNVANAVIGANNSTPIIFATFSLERFRVGNLGQWGIGGTNYGTAGQVFTSGGPSAAPSWSSTGSFTTVTASTSMLSSGTGGLGYSTGAGIAVTQSTSRTTTTPTTGTKKSGSITLATSTAVVGTYFSFLVPNTDIAATDTVVVSVRSSTNTYEAFVSAITAGVSFQITMVSVSGTASDTPVVNFTILKSVAA